MATRSANTFYDTLSLMYVLAGSKEGMTKGQIQKELKYVTMGQVGRMLQTLVQCGFAFGNPFPHGRTGKIVYRLTEGAAIYCASISREYTERN